MTFMESDPDIDFGGGVQLWYTNVYGVERGGAIISHNGVSSKRPDGKCWSGIAFNLPGITGVTWELVSRDPLSLSPSLLCKLCGWHVFIREGKVIVL